MPDAYFIADIHGNLEALEAVSRHLTDAPVFCLGDIVGYGADPNRVIDWVKSHSMVTVRGNHEEAVITGDVSWFNPYAARAVLWTRGVLSEASQRFIRGLTTTRTMEFKGLRVLMAHGSPTDPINEYVDPSTHGHLFEYYLRRFEVAGIALGHTHIPFVWKGAAGMVFNPGAVGQPRTGKPDASFASLTSDGRRLTVTHFSVKYDVATASNKILKAGLPSILASRLFGGY